jgi:UDP-GlcNAc:undecaprenyl-phosphate GlcNAc-1-phosphate transferase
VPDVLTSLALPGVLALAVSVVVTAGVRRVATLVGVVAVPKADRWHRERIPLLGGVALAVTVGFAVLVSPVRDRSIAILLGGAFTLFVVGLVDDLRPLKPQTKLLAQILVATTLAALGLQLRLTGVPFLDVLVTLVWIVGITNAMNLLDNMDGLAGGIAAIAVSFRLVFFLMDGNVEGATFAAIVLGALVGFLLFNFNPASIFMGDAGSLFVGTLVSGLSLVGGWPYSRGVASVLLFPVLILLVPIFDTTFVTLARTLAGRPISQGGRDHTSHRLVALGLSERQAVLLLWVVAALSGAVAFLSYRYGLSYTVVLVVFLLFGLSLFGIYLGRLQVYPAGEVRLAEGATFVSVIADFSYKRQVGTVISDVGLIVLAFYSAWLLRYEGEFSAADPRFIQSMPVVIAWQVFAFGIYRTYQGIWRYTSISDLIHLVKAATLGTMGSALTVVAVYGAEGWSRSVFVLDWLLLLVFVSASRISFRAIGEMLQPRAGDQRVLIYGAGDGGVMVLRELLNNRSLGLRPVGFIDDDRSKHRTQIHGVPVLGGREALPHLISEEFVSHLIVSSAKIPGDVLEEVGGACEEAGVAVVRASLRIE